MEPLLDYEIGAFTLQSWLLGAATIAVTVTVLMTVKAVLVNRLHALASKTRGEWDDILVDALRKTHWALFVALGAYLGGAIFLPATRAQGVLTTILMVMVAVQTGFWGIGALDSWTRAYRKRKAESEDVGALTHLGAARFIGQVVIWSTVFLLVLDNLGVEIKPVIAGLGVGGIAVALAVQNILGDLFASLSIILDKPFEVGDFLIVGDFLGKVEKVGLKTTRIRSLSGEQLVFSNTDLLQSRLRNYGRLYERRVVFQLGVVYQTTAAQLRQVNDIVRSAIENQDDTRFDRCHFHKYGDYSLNFEAVYFVLGPDYNLYMDIQQAINFEIYEAFEAAGIEFAYPTQTLFVEASDTQPAQNEMASAE